MKVAYLGPRASYTHQAALKAFGQDKSAQLIPKTTIDDAFAAVQSGETEFAVVPFENSSNGSVVFTLDLFVDQAGKHSDIIVTDEIYLPVSHCLVGRKAAGDDSPDNATRHIRKVYSHPQAWGQCKQFLNTKLKGVERQDVSSTSRAAEIVASETDSNTSAAISSRLAAELNGLDVLAEAIEDNKGNTTRFFVLRRVTGSQPLSGSLQSDNGSAEALQSGNASYKTMISFTIDHVAPGALADTLAVFKQHGLNLTSINTRPSGQRNWMYVFFVEFRGHKDNGAVGMALRELQQTTKSYRWLGSWRNALSEES